ncbi:MAG: hypothetical protein IAF38_19365, partial [Bacteroidia bacterium]|nr:hypothetical protein [Bacteroidia bacterium]
IYLQEPKKLKFVLLTLLSLAVIYIVFVKTRKWILSDAEDQVGRKMLYHENPLVLLKGFKFKAMAIFSCFGFYIERLVAGFPLVCYYGYNTVSMDDPFSQTYIYTGIFSFLLFVSLLWIKRKDTLFVFCLLMLVAPLSMYLNFPKPAPGIVADRFTFMSVTGFGLLFSYFIFTLVNSKKLPGLKKEIIFPLLLFFAFFSFKTIQRNFQWKSRLSLIEKDIKKVPGSAMMHFLKGSFLLDEMKTKQGEEKKALLDSSEISFKKSLAIFEGNASAWNYIGGIYFYHLKNYETARINFKRAYELDSMQDNKMLYAKSTFLSGRKTEFYEFAKREINAGKGNDFKQFISEFAQFIPADSLANSFKGLSLAGITDHKFIIELGTTLIDKGMKKEGIDVIFTTFKNGNRDKKLAEQLAEFCYDNEEIEKASFLMDIVEGKVR